MSNVTFIKDCPPILESGWSAYKEGDKATLRRSASLISKGYARAGWEPFVGLAVELPIAEQPEPTIPADDAPKREVKASNAARKLAEKHNLGLWSVNGTGKGGAITLADVRKLVK